MKCPKGCGPLEYRTHKTRTVRVFDLAGYAFIAIGIILAIYFLSLGDEATKKDLAILSIGLVLIVIGLERTSLVTTDLACDSCKGFMLESKSIDKTFKDKAYFIRSEISSSSIKSDFDCFECGNKMKNASIVVSDHSEQNSLLVPEIIEDVSALVGRTETIGIDGCSECDLVWFDSGERSFLSRGTSVIQTDSN